MNSLSPFRLDSAPTPPAKEAQRLDAVELALQSPRQLPDGTWVFDAVFATAGVPKRYADGDEVATEEALEAAAPLFAGLPVTRHDAHPWTEGQITPANASRYVLQGARVLGATYDKATRRIRGQIVLPRREDAALGVSVGWKVTAIDRTTKPARQTSLSPNHLTLTNSPRDPTARARLDAMKKIKINGVEYEVSDELFAALTAQQAEADKLKADLAALKGEADKAKGEATAMDAVLKDVQSRLKAADARDAAARLDALRKEAEPHVKDKAALAVAADEAAILRLALGEAGTRLDSVASIDTLRGAWSVVKGQAKAAASSVEAQKASLDNPPAPRLDANKPQGLAAINAKLREAPAPASK